MIGGLVLLLGAVAVTGLAAWLFLAGMGDVGDLGTDEPPPGRLYRFDEGDVIDVSSPGRRGSRPGRRRGQ